MAGMKSKSSERQRAKRHHFTPEFLIRPWAVNGQVTGYYWDKHARHTRWRTNGAKSFCYRIDLLTLEEHELGKDALETVFFGEIDRAGAQIRDKIMEKGVSVLSADDRSEFARLLLSLEARLPANVEKLKLQGAATFRDGLDNDPEVRHAFEEEGIDVPPSQFAEQCYGVPFEDRALLIIQKLVENPKVGGRLINARWGLLRADERQQAFVLADRPLIRVHGFDHPRGVWALPLSPTVIFVACNDPGSLQRLARLSPLRLAKTANRSSAGQALRYVFSTSASDSKWLDGFLRNKLNHD